MIKVYENFIHNMYKFNNEIVEIIDDLIWSDQIKITYRNLKGDVDSVLIDNYNEFDELFEPITYTKKESPIRYKIVYRIKNKLIDTIKDNIFSDKEAYSLANYLNKDPKYKLGTVSVIKY